MSTTKTAENFGERIMCHCGGCIAFSTFGAMDAEWERNRREYLEHKGYTLLPLHRGDRMDGCHCKETIAELRDSVQVLVDAGVMITTGALMGQIAMSDAISLANSRHQITPTP